MKAAPVSALGFRLSAFHEPYLSFVRQAKVGWWVAAAVALFFGIRAVPALGIPMAAWWVFAFILTLAPCVFVDRSTFTEIFWGDWSARTIRNTLIAAALSAAALIGMALLPGASVPLWPWWVVPLFAASTAVVSNAWLQTRGDQLGGLGILAGYFLMKNLFGNAHHGFLAYALVGVPLLAAGWIRMTSGSLLACFLVYLCSEELLWLAYRLGLAHS